MGMQVVTDQVIWMGLYYRADPSLIANRLKSATAKGSSWTQAWNVEQWDV